MIKLVLVAAALAVAALLIYAATRPDAFRIERATRIKAPPEKIFAFINDFRAWSAWSPWENIDPNLKRRFSGADKGKGAAYAWEGNKNVGSGRMEVTDATPPSKILIKLDFISPFEAHNVAEFTLEPQGDATAVRWAMYGPSPFVAKLMGVFFSMERMVGGQFETGLASLKALAEK